MECGQHDSCTAVLRRKSRKCEDIFIILLNGSYKFTVNKDVLLGYEKRLGVLLGVQRDDNLNFTEHISKLCTKANQSVE